MGRNNRESFSHGLKFTRAYGISKMSSRGTGVADIVLAINRRLADRARRGRRPVTSRELHRPSADFQASSRTRRHSSAARAATADHAGSFSLSSLPFVPFLLSECTHAAAAGAADEASFARIGSQSRRSFERRRSQLGRGRWRVVFDEQRDLSIETRAGRRGGPASTSEWECLFLEAGPSSDSFLPSFFPFFPRIALNFCWTSLSPRSCSHSKLFLVAKARPSFSFRRLNPVDPSGTSSQSAKFKGFLRVERQSRWGDRSWK